MLTNTRDGRGLRPLPRLALLLALGAPLAGCSVDDILQAEDPDTSREESLADISSVPSLRAAAIGGFRDGFSGEGQILYSGLLGDEWVHSGTFPTRVEVDQRKIREENATTQAVFRRLMRGRAVAEFVAQRYDAVGATGSFQQAEAWNLAGFSYVMTAENYCSGVPLSRFTRGPEGDEFIYGAPLTTTQTLDTAVSRFNRALAIAGAQGGAFGTQRNLAAVGRARALLDLGLNRAQEAAAAVANVPTGFVYRIEHSANTGAENNGVWSFNINQERWSVADKEGTNGLPYRSARDPRVLWTRVPANDVGFDRRTPQFDALKYPDRPAYAVVASGVEARLIEAEAALQRGDTETFLAKLNGLRANVTTLMSQMNFDYPVQLTITGFGPGLPALELPSTRRAQVDLLFQERAFWLWLTSHRLGDMRRLIRQYGRPANEVFPTGVYSRNGNVRPGGYGNDVNLPIPVDERNNPEFGTAGQCLNRDA